MADIFTRIVDGQQVNATNTNAPLIEIETVVNALDADLNTKVGDLTTLGTTPKTSVVGALGTATPSTTAKTVTGAINELDALIGTAASASGSIGTSIDTDGTLKAGAVDVAGVLATGVLDTLVPSPNLVYDPFNSYSNDFPSTGTIDGKRRWQQGTGVRAPDAASASGYVIETASGTAVEGKWLWLDEMGLMPGDVVSGGLSVYIPSAGARNISVRISARNAALAIVSSKTSSAVDGNDGWNWIPVHAYTIPADAVLIDLYLVQNSGTGTAKIRQWSLHRGSYAYQYTSSEGVMAGSIANALLHNGSYPTGSHAFGQDRLKNYLARAAHIKQTPPERYVSVATNATPISITTTRYHGYQTGNRVRVKGVGGNTSANGDWTVTYVSDYVFTLNGSVGNGEWTSGGTITQILPLRVAVIGDTWAAGESPITDSLQVWLQEEFGNGGPGWVGFGWSTNALAARTTESNNVLGIGVGSWVYYDRASTPVGKGVDIQHVTSSTALDSWQIRYGIWTDATIHYLEQNPGGTFEYKVDDDAWVTVATNGAGDAYKTFSIPSKNESTHLLTIRIKEGSTDPVTLFGVDLYNNRYGSGALVAELGLPSAIASDFALADATLWKDGLKAFAPHLVIMVIGSYDNYYNTSLTTFRLRMDTVINNIQATVMTDPATTPDIILIAPGEANWTTNPDMDAYANELRECAIAHEIAFLDVYKLFGPYADSQKRGLWQAGSTVSKAGKELVVRALRDNLLGPNESAGTGTGTGTVTTLTVVTTAENSPVIYRGRHVKLFSPYTPKLTRYKGQLHCHTNQSDGIGTPTQVVTKYKEDGMDFVAITDHNNATADPSVADILYIVGNEESASSGHELVVINTAINSALYKMQDIVDEAISAGSFCFRPHPAYKHAPCTAADLDSVQGCYGIEVYNGAVTGVDHETLIDAYLTRGHKAYLLAVDDLHYYLSGTRSYTWTAVYANACTLDEIMDNLKRGNFYAALGVDIDSILVDGLDITIQTPASCKIEWIINGGTVAQTDTAVTTSTYTVVGNEIYVRARLTLTSDATKKAWTNPIYVSLEPAPEFNGGSVRNTLHVEKLATRKELAVYATPVEVEQSGVLKSSPNDTYVAGLALDPDYVGDGLVTTVTLGDAGLGYAVNDELTIIQPGSSDYAKVKVTAVDAGDGHIDAIELKTPGTNYEVGNGLSTTVNPTGGSGATINITGVTARTVTRHNYIDIQHPSVSKGAVVTDAPVMRFDADAGTHLSLDGATTKSTPTGVDAWIKVNINGTLAYIPVYLSKTA